MKPAHMPKACQACNGRCATTDLPPGDIPPDVSVRRAGTLCDRCGGTGLDPDTLEGPATDYARAATRWLIFEAPDEWTLAQCRAHVTKAYGVLTLVEIQCRNARRPLSNPANENK